MEVLTVRKRFLMRRRRAVNGKVDEEVLLLKTGLFIFIKDRGSKGGVVYDRDCDRI